MKLELPYPPSANRYLRHTARGTYRTAEADLYLIEAQQKAVRQGVRYDATGGIVMLVTLHPRITKTGAASKTRLDLDNCVKVACDSLQGVCYANDRQITRMVLEVGNPIKGGGLTVEILPA